MRLVDFFAIEVLIQNMDKAQDILASLNVAELRARLEELDREQGALRVFLRAALVRERRTGAARIATPHGHRLEPQR
jgi:hypothetical protein